MNLCDELLRVEPTCGKSSQGSCQLLVELGKWYDGNVGDTCKDTTRSPLGGVRVVFLHHTDWNLPHNFQDLWASARGRSVANSIWDALAAGIHGSGRLVVVALTGGGSTAIGELLRVPGGSRSLLEAIVPYSQAALKDLLRGEPDQYCSEPTARAMAMAAWMRARALASESNPHTLVGLSATASLKSDLPKKGDHRIQVALQTASETVSYSLILAKGLRNRDQEERLATGILLLALAKSCGVPTTAAQHEFDSQLGESEHVEHRAQAADPAWIQLLLGEVTSIGWPTGQAPLQPQVVFPGAFNPLHAGHSQMAQIAADRLQREVVYELSIANVDKPLLDFQEIAERLAGIRELDPRRAVLITQAATFREKARLFPGCTFVVGADTLERIAELRYYGHDESLRDAALADLEAAGCRFLVFGREQASRFQSLDDLSIPLRLRELCQEIPESTFRCDVSSSQLRREFDQ